MFIFVRLIGKILHHLALEASPFTPAFNIGAKQILEHVGPHLFIYEGIKFNIKRGERGRGHLESGAGFCRSTVCGIELTNHRTAIQQLVGLAWCLLPEPSYVTEAIQRRSGYLEIFNYKALLGTACQGLCPAHVCASVCMLPLKLRLRTIRTGK